MIVLGTTQDAGFPQIGCNKECCKKQWQSNERFYVSCLGLVDPIEKQTWIFDATPDFKYQSEILSSHNEGKFLDGIFLTHAHIGHYTGLMDLGHEAMGAKNVKVHCMPKMKNFLSNNGPWSQLVNKKNIQLNALQADSLIQLNERISIEAFAVPHRDEYSETVGFKIKCNKQSLCFIPDIDKWSKWNQNIIDVVRENDRLYLDGTFYENGEIPGRDMSLIPHPFIQESMEIFKELQPKDKEKIHFIHFNHTNPVLGIHSHSAKAVILKGYRIAQMNDIFVF